MVSPWSQDFSTNDSDDQTRPDHAGAEQRVRCFRTCTHPRGIPARNGCVSILPILYSNYYYHMICLLIINNKIMAVMMTTKPSSSFTIIITIIGSSKGVDVAWW